MILITHGIVGGAVALGTGNIPLAIATSFASHFVLDSIPHWDYYLPALDESKGVMSAEIGRKGIRETIIKVGLDGMLGIIIPLAIAYFTDASYTLVFIGSAFAILPDFLQFIYFKTHTPLLTRFMKFHSMIHSKVRFDRMPIRGIAMQAGIWVLSVVYIVYFC